LKLGKDIKWIIYKISDDWKEIVVEETSKEANFDAFREKLLNAKSKDRKGKEGIGGRYAGRQMMRRNTYVTCLCYLVQASWRLGTYR
jgi:hypothetical protein